MRSVSSYIIQNSQGMLNNLSAISKPITRSSIFTIEPVTNKSEFYSRLV